MRVSNIDAPHFGHGGRPVALLGENDCMTAMLEYQLEKLEAAKAYPDYVENQRNA
jgi:hypothetical protein